MTVILPNVTQTDDKEKQRKSFTMQLHNACIQLNTEKAGNGYVKYVTYPQPSITPWHTEETLSHLYRASAKRSCGSFQGYDFISELSSFVLEIQIYADKQVQNLWTERVIHILKQGKTEKNSTIKLQLCTSIPFSYI